MLTSSMVAVKVDFPGGRPMGKLELAVRLGKQERKLRIDEDTDVQWSGNVWVIKFISN